MTDEQIIELAKQVGYPLTVYEGKPYVPPMLKILLNTAAAAEREACAKVCEDEAWRLKNIAVGTNSSATNNRAIQASNCADAIRARGEA